LFCRLNVVPMRLPPLKEQRGIVISGLFMARAGADRPAGKAPGEDAIAVLQAYEWPGNVRQLRNVIDGS
jgi:two-component system nitrogen regulation response regulator NtrX